MTILPVVERELRVAARRRHTYTGRVAAAAFCLLPVIWVLFIASSSLRSAEQGRRLFEILSNLVFFYCLLIGAFLTADSLSVEKRQGTLGLLFLTDLQGFDVVLGKLASSSLNSLYQIVGVFPILALAIILGGVSGADFAHMLLVMLNTLFLSLSCGMLASTLSRNDRIAMFATIGLTAGLALGPYLLAAYYSYNWMTASGPEFSLAFALPSPYFAFDIASSPPKWRIMAGDFYLSLGIAHALAWCQLIIASVLLPTMIHDRPARARFQEWRRRLQIWCYGDEATRRHLRSRLLNRNPFLWLAARDRLKGNYAWMFLVCSAGAWVAGYFAAPELFDWVPSFVLLLILHAVFKVWIASEVCARFVEDRQSGALELLLSTPLSVREILSGQQLALLRFFGWPILALSAADILLLRFALRSFSYSASSASIAALFICLILHFLVDAQALKWVGIWRSLQARTPNRALAATIGSILVLPTISWIFGWYAFTALAGMNSTLPRFVWAWFGTGLAADLFFGLRARQAAMQHFRTLALGKLYVRTFRGSLRAEFKGAWQLARHPGRVWSNFGLAMPRGRSIAIACAVAVTGLSAFIAFRVSLHRHVRQQTKAIREAGYPTRSAEVDTWHALVPINQNSALEIEQAGRIITGIAPRSSRDWDYARHPALPSGLELEGLAALVASNSAALIHLHQAARLPKSRFSVRWSDGVDALLPFVGPSKSLAELLHAEELVWLAEGNTDMAIRSCTSALALCRALANEPALVCQMARLSNLEIVHSALQHLLAHGHLSEAQLMRWQELVRPAEAEFDRGIVRSLAATRAEIIDLGTGSPRRFFRTVMGGGNTGTSGDVFTALFPIFNVAGTRERDLLCGVGTVNDCMAAMELPYPDRLAQYHDTHQRWKLVLNSHKGFFLSGMLLWPISEAFLRHADGSARIRTIQAALSVERFRLEKGTLPLLLDFDPSIPADPFDGKPLRYQPLDRGYRIYSIGRNVRDDNGETASDTVFSNLPVQGIDH